MKPFRTPLILVKWANYEYWPWYIFYIPLLPYILWLAAKSGSLTFFTSLNPFIEAGGVIGESKTDILKNIPGQYLPASVYVKEPVDGGELLDMLREARIGFPLIIKPDVGERGKGVEKIHSREELEHYLSGNTDYYIIQEFIDYEIELGVMFHRLPGSREGIVSSVTLKEFLTVTGNGTSSIEELLKTSDRYRFQVKFLKKKHGVLLEKVLPAGEDLLLQPIGNHCKGTKFINASYLISGELHQVFNSISSSIEGFDLGRFDLKVKSIDSLVKGLDIRILELNGVTSEPGHIYDASNGLFRAYKDMMYQWRIIYELSRENRKKGIKPVSAISLLNLLLKHLG